MENCLYKFPDILPNILIYDTTSKNGDCNVLLNCLYQSIWLNIFIAQCLKYWACEPQIMSYKNLPGTLVHMYLIKFFKIMIFI